MNRFLRRLIYLADSSELAISYRELAAIRQDRILSMEEEMMRVDLEHARCTRNLIQQFLTALDDPRPELRDNLTAALADHSDHVARLEEYAP